MQILRNNISKGNYMVLSATCSDDFYLLSTILIKGDKIRSKTNRKVSFDNGKTQQKIVCTLQIEVESVSADLDVGILYVKGKVCKENDYVSLGSYHTMNLELNHDFSIEKSSWSSLDINAIKEATKEEFKILFVIFYEKDCVLSAFGKSSSKILSKFESKSKNFAAIQNSLKSYVKTYKSIIIASNLKIGDEFSSYVNKNTKLAIKSLILSNDYKNKTNTKVIEKLVVDPQFAQEFANITYIEDLKVFQQILPNIKNGDVMTFLGLKELKEVFDYGALDKLFMTDKMYRPATIDKRKEIEKIISEANSFRAKIYIIPIQNELGEELDALGGVAGTLLFNFK